MTRNHYRAGAVLAAVVLALAACSAPPPPAPPLSPQATEAAQPTAPSPSASSATPSRSTSSAPPAVDGEPMDALEASPSAVSGAPRWDDEVAAQAAQRAQAFMRAFARPELGYDEWQDGIAGFLTENGAEIYQTVDPANVPATAVVGEPVVRRSGAAAVAYVDVETDAGLYEVTLTRIAQGDPWLVDYADPQF